ncbi:MAG: hypothetical protein L0154_18900 [Chloroflexi bacterium]|nr:hypothetical protein [Chloroflexota bacterium]
MKILTLLIFLLTVMLPLPGHAQDAEDIPYLYYFDSARRAFIVERADGADRRILGEGVLDDEEGAVVISSPGWSPDGRWLAFLVETQSGRKAHVISVDGETTLSNVDELNTPTIQWSPDGQQLFAISQKYLDGILTVAFDVIDVENDERQTLHEFEYTSPTFQPAQYQVQWIGEDVIVEGLETVEDVQQPVIYVFREGQFHARIRADNLIRDENFRYFTSVTGWVAQRTSSGLELVNVLTSEQVTHQIAWDDDYAGEYRMIWNGDEGVLSGENIWYVATDTILQIVRFDPAFRPVARYFDWSPDSQHLVMVLDELVFQFTDGLVTRLDLSVQHIFVGFSLTWIDGDSAFLLVEEALFRHDFDTQNTRSLAETIPYRLEPAFAAAPSGELIGYVNQGAVLFNPASENVTLLPPHPNSYHTVPGGRVEWNGDWVLIYENAFLAGNYNPYFLSVAREDGNGHHAVGRILQGDRVYAGWLPAAVDPTAMPHAPLEDTHLRPGQILEGEHWSFRLVWSPDGTKIAAGLDWDMGSITIWDVERGIPLETIHDISLDTALRWEDGELVLQNLPRQNIDFDSNDEWRVIGRDAEGTYVELYNIESSRFVCPVMGEFDVTSSASLSPDGKYLATGHRYEPARIWDVEICTVIATLPETAPGVAFSPDGTQLAAGVSWDIHIFNVARLLGIPQLFG